MKVLVVSAHPDDETLGCGGTIVKHVRAGDEVYWLIATAPVGPPWSAEQRTRERRVVEVIAKAYGMKRFFALDLPSAGLDQVPVSQLVEAVRGVVEQVNPQVVYTVSPADVHTDHQRVFEALGIVLKPFKNWAVRRVLAYECLSSTDAAPPVSSRVFVPTAYSDISASVEDKLAIMRLYESEVQPEPLPRSESAIRALARYRGATIGRQYAEAFMVIRELF
ncbi:MAG: hypothetical protein A3D28_02735 [Omnitrophica bacterium RIFCSPHIGHO2_02_FULL_63_14]|nr:MAG: hypothetical protein A3D28_02735 [Omnitrophica bacterium RIFCSPHIGHO2_02_FULL_63_14]